MDPSLVRQREAFKARAMKMPAVEKRKRTDDSTSKMPNKHHRPPPRPKPTTPFDYKSTRGSSQLKFAVLTKIVKYLKECHQQGDGHPLDIDQVLDETNQLDVGQKLKHWLVTEALNCNPKIDVVNGDTYKFKPKYNIRDRRGLQRLLDKHDQQGRGGIMMDDVEESLPRFQKALRILGDQVVIVTRPIDKKKVLFYNDKSFLFNVDEDIQKLWRGVAVDGADESKIEDYLSKQGIASMQDIHRVAPIPKRKRMSRKKIKAFKTHNEHMGDTLQDYSEGKK